MAHLDFAAPEEGFFKFSGRARLSGEQASEEQEGPAMKCPYCEHEIAEFASEYSYAQAEIIVVVMCPHCRKILGIVNHDCED